MKRRTLDILFALGGVGIAVLLFAAGMVLTANANFASNYVHDQLAQQQITFKPADALTGEERALPGMVEYAGQQLTTGKQAEAYAGFIGLHLKGIAGGKTYAQLGDVQTDLRTQIADAQKTNPEAVTGLQKQLTDITAQRETVFKGETLRGLLLTSYGFSEFGAKAAQAALVAYGAAVLMILLAAAGFAHAHNTPKNVAFAPIEAPARQRIDA
jgi:hypothetical protein